MRWPLLAALLAALLFSSAATAQARNFDIYHWDVLPYPGINNAPGSYYADLLASNERRFKWTVDTAHSTRVSYNDCTDYRYFDYVDIPAHSQTAQPFSETFERIYDTGDCLVIRGYNRGNSTLFNRNAQVFL